jgi:hypothetical protein
VTTLTTLNARLTDDTIQKLRVAVGASEEASAETVIDTVLERLALFEIYHRGLGWIEAQRFRLDEKRKAR